MKRFALITAAVITLAGCANQQSDNNAVETETTAATVNTQAAQSELLQLWERHCNREELSIEEMQTIASTEMPAELTSQCFSK